MKTVHLHIATKVIRLSTWNMKAESWKGQEEGGGKISREEKKARKDKCEGIPCMLGGNLQKYG